jgi:fibronectin-binding autotransporter adhesin
LPHLRALGSISGPFSFAFDNESIAGIEGDSVLSGDNTYTGTTTIDTGTLQLGDGGATGSIGGGAITEFSGGSLNNATTP